MPNNETESDLESAMASSNGWDVATTHRKRSQRNAARRSSSVVWKQVSQHYGCLLAEVAQIGYERDSLLEALIFVAVTSTPDIELFTVNKMVTATKEVTDQRYLNQLVFATKEGDVQTFMNVMRAWTACYSSKAIRAKGIEEWCKASGVSERNLKLVEKKVQRSYQQIQQFAPRQFLPQLRYVEDEPEKASSRLVYEIVCKLFARNLCMYSGDKSLGYVEIVTGKHRKLSDMSVINFLHTQPCFIVSIDCPQSRSQNRYNVVVSEKDALAMIKDITGEFPEEVISRLVPQTLSFRNIGMALRRRLQESWDSSLQEELMNICQEGPCLLKVDDTCCVVNVLCLTKYHSAVSSVVEDNINSLRELMRDKSTLLNYPFACSRLRLAVDDGVTVISPLAKDNYMALSLYKTTSTELTDDTIKKVFKEFEIKVTKTESLEDDLYGLVMFKSCSEAVRAYKEVECHTFVLEPHYPKSVNGVCGKRPLVLMEQICLIKVAWPAAGCHVNTKAVPNTNLFRDGLLHALSDLNQSQIRCSVFSTGSTAQPYGARITVGNTTATTRALSFLSSAEICDRKLEIINLGDVSSQLRSFTFDIDDKVYAVISDVLWSRLGNFMRQPSNGIHCKEQGGTTGRFILRVQCVDLQTAKHILDKLQDLIKPLKVSSKWTQHDPCDLSQADRDLLLKKIMADTKTYIAEDEINELLYVYGSKSARHTANELLESYVLIYRKWFITNLFQDKYRSDILMQMMKGTPIPKQLGNSISNEVVRLCPQEGYMLHKVSSFYKRRSFTNRINDAMKAFEVKAVMNPEQVNCVVCYSATVAKDCYHMETCGHSYCMDCLKSQIKASLDNTLFPLCCAGCEWPFTTQDLMNLCGRLKLFKLQEVLRGSLRAFLNSNAKQFRSCPHLSCEGVIALEALQHDKQLQCCLCQRRVCPDCLEMQHEDFTCEDFGNTKKILVDWIKENPSQRKQCPSCEIGIEKIDGCDNVFCSACKRSVCWECMQHFADDDQCYEHLDDEHGGI